MSSLSRQNISQLYIQLYTNYRNTYFYGISNPIIYRGLLVDFFNNSTKANEISGKTGEICEQSGVYKCTEHPTNEVPIPVGSKFPECKINDGHPTSWLLVRKPGTTS